MARRAVSKESFLPIEAEMQAAGYRCIVGIDEAGRGPLAGPVVAAAVLLPVEGRVAGLRDSKRLTARQREAVYSRVCACAVSYGVGVVSSAQIDQHDILWATKEAMLQAVQQLDRVPDMLLIDGTDSLPLPVAQRTLVRGDALCASIAAASVIAKVTRDRLMIAYARRYPVYGFERHKGYPTREHLALLRCYGACAIHRRSFRGVPADGARGDGEMI
jgi:ribonuclease HII